MKIRSANWTVLRAAAVVALAAGSAQATQIWQRASNWVPGTVPGSTFNNPSTVGGVPAWQYESTQGGGIASLNPWYAQPTQLMTWDPVWYGTPGYGVWSNGDDLNPPIQPGCAIHNVHTSVWADIPVIRWLYPYSNAQPVDVTGTLTVNWSGVNGLGRPVNVDVVVARRNALTSSMTVLYSTTVNKPNQFPSVGDSVFLPLSLIGVSMAAGDSLVFTHRGQTALGPLGAWVNLYDNVTVTTIPAPGGVGLLATAGLLAARRRRR